jgi:hypothetical protein
MMEPYVFEAISLETGDLFVDVTDEYTFYTASGAHVDSANVILKHPYTGVVIAQGLTNENGTILMTNIPEGNYTLVVEAANHSGYLQNVFIEKGKVNEKSVFISFQPVTYSWNVVPTQIQDHYEITLIVEFVTNVPAPVVLLDMPDSMPHLENNETYPFIVTVTNMGLITAQDLHLQFPDDPEYEFVNMMDNVNVLPQQALQIPVVMKRRETNKSGGLNCLYFVFASCSFECGANHQYQTSVHTLTFNTRICTEPEASLPSTPGPDISCSECPPPDPGVAAGGGPPVYPTWPILFNIEIGESSCDPCMQEIGKFLLDQACEIFAANPLCEIYEVLGCYNSIVEGCGDENGIYSMNCAEALWDCFGELPEGMQTAFDFAKLCQPKPEGKSPFAMSFLPTLQANMQIAYDEMAAMKIWRTEFFGDSAWVYCNETEFIYFRNYFDSISQMDTVSVTPELLTHRPTNISTDQVASFAARWNSTLNRENGLPYDTANVINFNIIEDSYEIIDSCEKLSVQAGYASTSVLAQAQMDSLRYYYERESGSVCAKVSLKFSQSMTMTREAFDGTLTINNGHETDPIENILLELVVKNEAGENSNDLFQINTLSMNELTGINGTGILGPKKSGTAIVRFIPEKGAAPTVARFYSFGGNLSYKDPYTGEIVTRP